MIPTIADSTMNRRANVDNPFQADFKRVLCLCSAGLLRSPTAAWVLSNEPFNFNTRAAGMNSEYALIQLDQTLMDWADEIVCMEYTQTNALEMLYLQGKIKRKKLPPVINLNISDSYSYRDPELIELIKTNYPIELSKLNGVNNATEEES